ncbi:MAG: hypothetical protein PHN39_00910 [Candidatus Pacebacteria bacterium]|nr:hypothetical protein [Candidatus Paceibacterota bacterium]
MSKGSNKQSRVKEETNETLEEAAERLAQLIWDHWLYMQEQKKKEKGAKSFVAF